MSRDARAYLEQHIIPLIADNHPRVSAEMCFLLEGSHAMGLADEHSDLEAIVYLPDDLWEREGARLQLLLLHAPEPFSPHLSPACDFPGHPENWVLYGHPEVNVHPVSWLLDGKAGHILDGGDVPWEDISPEALFKFHHETLVLRDPREVVPTLRDATRPEKLPEWLWRKRLILKLADLKGAPGEFELAVKRRATVEASILLGSLLADLLRLGFLICRQYHPYPKRLRLAFERPPFPAEALPLIDSIAAAPQWPKRIRAVHTLLALYTEIITATGALEREVLEYLYPARDREAWSNPGWLEQIRGEEQKARQAGYEPGDRWIWSLWDSV